MRLSATVLKPSVLIVDDDIEALEEIAESLQSHSLTVHTASNVELAVKLAEEQCRAFIIMDYLLPGRTGTEAVSEIHKLKDYQGALPDEKDDSNVGDGLGLCVYRFCWRRGGVFYLPDKLVW
jgi:DNA-binding response OmpR family regulator